MQIEVEAKKLTKFLPFSTVLMVGGESKVNQLRQLEKACHIVVATPGRLNDVLETSRYGSKKFADTKVLVLDEADRLLEMVCREITSRDSRKKSRKLSNTFPQSTRLCCFLPLSTARLELLPPRHLHLAILRLIVSQKMKLTLT